MGVCKYCGKPAGFLKSVHKECEKKYIEGKKKLIETIKFYFEQIDKPLKDLNHNINLIAKESFIKDDEFNNLKLKSWKECVDKAFDDGVLTEDEEKRLMEMVEIIELDEQNIKKSSEYEKLVKGAILRDLLNGNIPERITVDGALPFNFQKKEKLIWVFQNVDYYEKRTRRVYVGGYQGFSIKIAKGVYYRVGGFKGNPVNKNETVYLDTGIMAITNKHIYFAGSNKIFRIKYDKIISFIPYSDGIGIQRDAKTAKPQIFITGDGWFTLNLVQNIANLEE